MQVVNNRSAVLGEGPHWCEGTLYWVDILGKKVLSWSESEGEKTLYSGEKTPSSIVTHVSDGLVVTFEDGFYKLLDGAIDQISLLHEANEGIRFNDGKCDDQGRFWAGTMHLEETEPSGSLYVLKEDKKLQKVLDEVTVSNGLCWDDSMERFYYVDSPTKCVMEYQLNPETLELTEPRVVYRVEEEDVYPDGMCIDLEGNLWLALWNGFSVLCIDPESGAVLQKVDVPCKKVTSCCFGGPVFTELYITTASKDMSSEDWEKYPDSGKVFKCEPGTVGKPENQSLIEL